MKKIQLEKSAIKKKYHMEEKVHHGKVHHGKKATWKKYNIKKRNMVKVKHGNSRSVARTPQVSTIESFVTIFKGFMYCCCKVLPLGMFMVVLATPLEIVQHEHSATAKCATGEDIATCKNGKQKHCNM